MKNFVFLCTVLMLLIFGFGLTSANAIILTYDFSGEVSNVLRVDSSGAFGSAFSAGDSLYGTYTLDTDQSPNFPRPGEATYDGSSFDITINGYNFSGSAQHRVFNDDPLNSGVDAYSIVNETGYSVPDIGGLISRTFFIQFFDSTGSVFDSTDMVIDPSPLTDFTHQINGLRLDNPEDSEDYGLLYFNIGSVTSRVPEPGTMLLLGIGLVGLAGVSRKKFKK